MDRHQEEAKAYLSQAYLIDRRIGARVQELECLRSMAACQGSPCLESSYDPNRAQEASFVMTLEKAWDVEEEIRADIERLIKLREEISTVIDSMEDPAEEKLLRCRYIRNYTWPKIAGLLNCSERHVYRLHKSALEKIMIPG